MTGAINMFRAGLAVLLRPGIARNKPVHLQIEPTTVCNLKCGFCVREKNVFRPKNLSFDQFQGIFDEIRPSRVTFAGDGEPLLCPDIFRMISHARSHGAHAIVTTNFTTGHRVAEKILDSGLHALRISIDAATARTYVLMRKADFHGTILEGIRRVNALKSERRAAAPDMGFEYVLGRDNIGEMQDVLALAADLRLSRVNFRPLNLVGIEERESELLGGLTRESYREALETAAARAAELGVPTNLGEILALLPFYEARYAPDFNPEKRSPDCIYPWVQVYISVDGDMTPCCALQMDERVSLGNVFKDGFREVWNGKRYTTMRRQIVEHRVPFRSCITCEGRGPGRVIRLALSTPGHLKRSRRG